MTDHQSWVGHYIQAETPGAVTIYFSPIGSNQDGAAEADAQVVSAAGVYSLTSFRVSANGGNTATITFRKNGADGNQTVTVGSGMTGWFQDTTHSDTVSEGDTVCWKLVCQSGITFNGVLSALFNHASNAVTYPGQGVATMSNNFTSGDEFFWLGGFSGNGNTTRTQVQFIKRAAGTYSKLSMMPNSGGQQPDVHLRINSSNGNLAIANNTGGGARTFDNTNTDSVSSGDAICFCMNMSGKRWRQVYVRDTSSDDKFDIVTGEHTSTGNGTNYLPIFGGSLANTGTEANAQAKAPFDMTLSKLRYNVSVNFAISGSQVLTLRINGSDATNTVTVPSGSTGQFEDTTHSDSVTAGDLVSIKSVGTQSSGSNRGCTALLAEQYTAPPASAARRIVWAAP